MASEVYYGNICVGPTPIYVRKYNCRLPASTCKYETCFLGHLYNTTCPYTTSIYFPISLFNGKKEGDSVTLNYVFDHINFSVVVTLNQTNHGLTWPIGQFQDILYERILWYGHSGIGISKSMQFIITYMSHVAYCQSLGYEPKLKITHDNAIFINHLPLIKDVCELLKPLYYQLYCESDIQLTL